MNLSHDTMRLWNQTRILGVRCKVHTQEVNLLCDHPLRTYQIMEILLLNFSKDGRINTGSDLIQEKVPQLESPQLRILCVYQWWKTITGFQEEELPSP